jgi:hypothetical protein
MMLRRNNFIVSRNGRRVPATQWQTGQATVEYLYVVPILLVILLASMQFVFIYEAKLALNYATFVAARQGALHNGSMASIQSGLASGLAPLFNHGKDLPSLKAARALAKNELGNNQLTLIKIVNPTPDALSAFDNGAGEIPNDNLMYRGTAATGGMSVQDANLLKVRVTYCVKLVVPIINRMIYAFQANPPAAPAKIDSASYTGGSIGAPELLTVAPTTASSGLCNGTVIATDPNDPNDPSKFPYRIPITAEAVVRMQSPFQNPSNVWTAP